MTKKQAHTYIPQPRTAQVHITTYCDECGELLFQRRGTEILMDKPMHTVRGRFVCEHHNPDAICERCGYNHAAIRATGFLG